MRSQACCLFIRVYRVPLPLIEVYVLVRERERESESVSSLSTVTQMELCSHRLSVPGDKHSMPSLERVPATRTHASPSSHPLTLFILALLNKPAPTQRPDHSSPNLVTA